MPNAATQNLPLVAVVILNWNGAHYLKKFLPSVCASSYANKIIYVADNFSTDDSVAVLQKEFPSVSILINTQNDGFAKGYNWALQQIKADYYVLLNSDVEVSPHWLEPLVTLMQQDATIGACQPKILAYHQPEYFEYAGAAGGFIDAWGYPFAKGRVFETCEKDHGQYNTAGACFWASGAALFIRADAYHAAGGLDEYFFAHQEEIDLCWRLQLMGYKIFVEPAAVVYHVGAGTLAQDSPKKTYLNFRNNLIMLSKNLPIATACIKIPLRLLLDALAAFRYLIKGSLAHFFAIAKAHVHYVGWLLFKPKTTIFIAKKNKNLLGKYAGSIVWDYFVKRKKTFLEIYNRK